MARDQHAFARAVGAVILRRRLALSMSQADLGEAVGVTQGSVWLTENGKHNPSLRTLQSYAEALGVKLSRLLAEAEPKSSPKAARNPELYALAKEHGVSVSTASRWLRNPGAMAAWVERKKLRECAALAGIPMQVAYRRKSANWALERIVSTPVGRSA